MAASRLDDVLSRLKGCHRSGTRPHQYSALCPAHDDSEQSLSVGIGDNGNIVFRCHRGCDFGAILAALKMTAAEVAGDEKETSRSTREYSGERLDKVTVEEWEDRCSSWAAEFARSTKAGPMLASVLRVPEWVFEQFPGIGARGPDDHPKGACWTFPERNADGRIIGVGLRFLNNKKQSADGSLRGLSLPAGWKERPGPLHIVEGPSDVLALTAAGVAAIGRPSNVGGVLLLAELINEHVPADRQIIVMGENDQKANGDWPGRDGMMKVASRLARETKREILASLPPGTEKDARAWVTKLVGDGCTWQEGGDRWHQFLRPFPTDAQQQSPDNAVSVKDSDGRVNIHFTSGCNEKIINDEVIEIIASDPQLFWRSNELVRVVYSSAEKIRNIKFPPSPTVFPVESPTLRELISSMVEFTTEGRMGLRRPGVPDWCTNAIVARKSWDAIRYLQAVVECPFLRPDGSLVSEPGYDDATGVYLYPHAIKPILPDVIDRNAALAAWDEIQEVICDFPFQYEFHKSSWLCGLLTPLARFAFDGPAPLFLVDGNTPGTGKGLLANLASIILTGYEFATVPYSHDGEEMRKKITACATRGTKGILLDNIAGNFGGSVIDAMLTSTVWEDRLLGSSTLVSFPLLSTFWGTGNNVQIAGDGARRIAHIRLHSSYEHPEERTGFKHERLERWVLQHRKRLLGAALTILMAYCRAGRPAVKLLPWGSYDGWTEVVRSAVIWLGLADPAEGKQELRASSDPMVTAMESVLCQWHLFDSHTARGITCNQIVAEVFPKGENTPLHLVDLAEAISTMCSKVPTGKELGNAFKKFKGRLLGGRQIDHVCKVRGGIVRWGIFDADKNLLALTKGGSGVSGGTLSPTAGTNPDHSSTEISYNSNTSLPLESKQTLQTNLTHPSTNGDTNKSDGSGSNFGMFDE